MAPLLIGVPVHCRVHKQTVFSCTDARAHCIDSPLHKHLTPRWERLSSLCIGHFAEGESELFVFSSLNNSVPSTPRVDPTRLQSVLFVNVTNQYHLTQRQFTPNDFPSMMHRGVTASFALGAVG